MKDRYSVIGFIFHKQTKKYLSKYYLKTSRRVKKKKKYSPADSECQEIFLLFLFESFTSEYIIITAR